MPITISNEFLSAGILSKGAELCSIKNKSVNEFMWQAMPEFWNRHAPLLFPFVGKLKNDSYIFDNKTFRCSQHGFARDSEFTLIEKTDDSCIFELNETKTSLEKFPFRFSVRSQYQLKSNSLFIKQSVSNNNNVTMPFSIGAHPAFNCPFNNSEKFEDYFIEFEKPEMLSSMILKNGNFENDVFNVLNNEKVLKLNYNTFNAIDTYVFQDFKSDWVELKSSKSKNAIRVSIKGFPYLGIWTKPNAPFICIEPWYGLADFKNHDGNIFNKKGIQLLQPGALFECEYFIEINVQ